jgi:uncharacterized membrane protein
MKESFHHFNIWVHVLAGSLAMIIGIWLLIAVKGDNRHKNLGRRYFWLMSVIITTALLGGAFFDLRPFLILLSILVFYTSFAAVRTVTLKGQRPQKLDNAVLGLTFLAGATYFVKFDFSNAAMSVAVVYSTLGALALHLLYDLGKNLFTDEYLKKTWRADHIFRSISSFGGLVMAFAGNVLNPDWQPWSQLLPGIISYVLIGYFIVRKEKTN